MERRDLACCGGPIGVAIGFAGSWVVGRVSGWTTRRRRPKAVFIAVAFSAAVGVFFGFYPARQAASAESHSEALRVRNKVAMKKTAMVWMRCRPSARP